MKLGVRNKGGVLSVCIFILSGFIACSPIKIFSRTQMMMGDVPVTVQIRAPFYQKEKAFLAMEGTFGVARGLENELSEFKSGSDTSRLNNAKKGETIPVGTALFTVLRTAEKISRETNGAFDVTHASSETVSFRDLELSDAGQTVHLKKKGIRIGVSGIAKGYIVDQMSESLIQNDFNEHLVNAGGDLRARGIWEIGVRDPDRGAGSSLCLMTLKDQSASTSGLYERGDHLVDPRMKKKVKRGDIRSATVVGPSTVETDALATAAFVLSPDKAREIFSRLPENTLLLDSDFASSYTVSEKGETPCLR